VDVALNAVTPEAGDSFDLLIWLDYQGGAAGRLDVYYKNKTAGQGPEGADDIVTISHAVKAAATRDEVQPSDTYISWLHLTGTATVESVEVGWEPVVMLGDAQVSIGDDRIGKHLPIAFEHPRIYWDASIADNAIVAGVGGGHSTPAYLRYKHGTPGEGDLYEMRGAVVAVCAMGLVDIDGIASDVEANVKVLAMLDGVAEILAASQDNGNTPLVIGLPPYNKAPAAEEHEAQAIVRFNRGLEGVCVSARCAFYDCWPDMIESSTRNDGIPAFDVRYSADGELLNSAGAEVVASRAAAVLERGVAGGDSAPLYEIASQELRMRGYGGAIYRVRFTPDGTWEVIDEMGATQRYGTLKEVWSWLTRTV